MPIVKCNYEDLVQLLGHQIEKETLIEKIPMIGADIEKIEGDDISIEFFPDRPDLLSVEGVARALRAFLGISKGVVSYPVENSSISLIVDPSVKTIRPHISAAFIKGVQTNEKLILSMMELQEKLHFSIGKDRKKMAIGLHDARNLTPPFTYYAIEPTKISFVPLLKIEKMDLNEILTKHEKGIDYAHLLKGYSQYPIITDKNDSVLSFPPIINGELTAVNLSTDNYFIEVTGIDKKSVDAALTIMATALAERGGLIQKVKIIDDKIRRTPDLTPTKKNVNMSYIHEILGMTLNEKSVEALEKMGYDAVIKNNTVSTTIPKWRTDILHPIDLIEDIAIGYGYENFQPALPKDLTFGFGGFSNRIYSIMIGLGFTEVMTLSLSNKINQFIKFGIKPKKIIEIKNPITEKHSCLRYHLLPSLLDILQSNKHHDLPQKIFEIGEIVDKDAINRFHLCGIKIDAKTGYTECKSIIEAILRELNINSIIKNSNHPAFIKGRQAEIIYKNRNIGHFGEIAPRVIENFDLGHPIIAFEIDIDGLIRHVN